MNTNIKKKKEKKKKHKHSVMKVWFGKYTSETKILLMKNMLTYSI